MDKATFELGREIRSSVLGKEFVDAAFKAADDFNMPMQELVTEYCWGAVWGRPGLDKKQRSMLNLAMISCLNRPHELRLHIAPVNVGVQYERIFDGVPLTAWSSTSGRWTPEVTHLTYRR